MRPSTTLGLATFGLLLAGVGLATAAPLTTPPLVDLGTPELTLVHGSHRSCQRGPAGIHRHDRWSNRIACRTWDGRGRRPGTCVRIGPIQYCG